MYFEKLDPRQRQDYLRARQILGRGGLTVALHPSRQSRSEVLHSCQGVVHALRWSCPELFWVDFWNVEVVTRGDGSRSLEFASLIPPEELPARRRLFERRVTELCRLAHRGSTPLDKESIIHDTLARCVPYRDEDGHRVSTAESVLLRCYGTCEGYSKAFLLLCTRCRISCAAIYGGTTQDGHASHAWNAVDLGVGIRFVDATWDGCCTTDLHRRIDRVSRKYFNFSPDFCREHFPDPIFSF